MSSRHHTHLRYKSRVARTDHVPRILLGHRQQRVEGAPVEARAAAVAQRHHRRKFVVEHDVVGAPAAPDGRVITGSTDRSIKLWRDSKGYAFFVPKKITPVPPSRSW